MHIFPGFVQCGVQLCIWDLNCTTFGNTELNCTFFMVFDFLIFLIFLISGPPPNQPQPSPRSPTIAKLPGRSLALTVQFRVQFYQIDLNCTTFDQIDLNCTFLAVFDFLNPILPNRPKLYHIRPNRPKLYLFHGF